uniref:Uncharacterized protein n=1 Tax=Rhizophora mucronata TaxID=61149 RepID=A0A2P2P4M6_RHIMU
MYHLRKRISSCNHMKSHHKTLSKWSLIRRSLKFL